MHRIVLALAAAVALPGVAFGQQTSTPTPTAPAPAPGHYSTATTDIGVLLDDPAAKDILEKAVPGLTTNPQSGMMRGMTLASLQQYVPDQITAAKLGEIDKAFQALPVKK